MGKSRGRHRAAPRQSGNIRVLGIVTVAAAGCAVIGLTPTLSASPELVAVYYLRGTNIGDEPTDGEYEQFMDRVFTGTGTPVAGNDPRVKIPYNAGFWPVSRGGLSDLTWDASVAQGVELLDNQPVGEGDFVFGFSQGAVAVSKYKEQHGDTGATYVLVENPSRPNGGVMTRFEGLHIPILDITFSGATPDTDDITIDVARQYDGWADFPTYPLNLLATTNAVLGIVYVHGSTQREEDLAAEIADIDTSDPRYYQEHGNTTYYLIPTERLPLLMPFEGIVPEPVLAAADAPLRYLVELGYDRSDYSAPTPAKLVPNLNPIDVATGLAEATTKGIDDGLTEAGVSIPDVTTPSPPESEIKDVAPRRESLASQTRKRLLPDRVIPRPERKAISSLSDTRVSAERNPAAAKAVASALKALKPDFKKPDFKKPDFKKPAEQAPAKDDPED